ncbi:Uncharacterised protein [Paucimonas lemoignei]|nr:Uncharacterised protein [Paucimonas lemoignei]
MKANKSITRAFCVELQQELSIAAARREYFSMESPQRFEFLCSTEACRTLGAKITGVNYAVKPQEQLTFVSAHYRANPRYEHHPDCEWVGEDSEDETPAIDEPEEATTLRKARRKLDDYIDIFEPSIKEKPEPAAASPKDPTPSAKPDSPNPPRAAGEAAKQLRGVTRTHNLERLVDSYRQARATLSAEELALLKLRVASQGEVSLRAYFRQIKYAQLGDNGRVLFGGGTVERFGLGFRFKYFDRLQGKPVFLYVSPAQMQAYRSRRYISELLSHAGEVRFFTMYALATVSESPSGKSISVEVEDLRHLVIVLGPAKESALETSV